MELQLKHLAVYLPYGLKVSIMGELKEPDSHEPIVFELVGLDTNYVEYHEIGRSVTEQAVFSDCFLILRPLSDLTKEIEVNGKKFVPIERLAKLAYGNFVYNEIKFNENEAWISVTDSQNRYGYSVSKDVNLLKYDVAIKLLEWHFDIHGLIEKGLAIDINTF